jgi:hypothetical protein
MNAGLSADLTDARDAGERKAIVARDRYLSKALEKAERGERIFGVIWDDEGKEWLFASTTNRKR